MSNRAKRCLAQLWLASGYFDADEGNFLRGHDHLQLKHPDSGRDLGIQLPRALDNCFYHCTVTDILQFYTATCVLSYNGALFP